MAERTGLPPKMLHDMVARAEAATAGKWRSVGRKVFSGEGAIFEAAIPRHGVPEEARRNAAFVAAASPSGVISIVNEVFRLRRAVNDAARQVEEARASEETMRQEMQRARAVAAAVTLPTNVKAAETAGRLASRIKKRAPEVSTMVDSLAAIARARAEVEDEM